MSPADSTPPLIRPGHHQLWEFDYHGQHVRAFVHHVSLMSWGWAVFGKLVGSRDLSRWDWCDVMNLTTKDVERGRLN